MNLRIFAPIFAIVFCVSPIAIAGPRRLAISSSNFVSGGLIPSKFSCEGSDVNPQLSWSSVPKGTKSIAIILEDPDAADSTFYHWGRYNIPPSRTAVAMNDEPGKGARNDFGTNYYQGPCPEEGESHRYVFSVYALSKKLPAMKTTAELSSELKKGKLKKTVLAKGSITASFSLNQPNPRTKQECENVGGLWICDNYPITGLTCSCYEDD